MSEERWCSRCQSFARECACVVDSSRPRPTAMHHGAIGSIPWRGWRDKQPQRNPVIVKHVGDDN